MQFRQTFLKNIPYKLIRKYMVATLKMMSTPFCASVLLITKVKGGPPDINIAQIWHLSNFFELKRTVYIHLQVQRTRKVLDILQILYRKVYIIFYKYSSSKRKQSSRMCTGVDTIFNSKADIDSIISFKLHKNRFTFAYLYN
jgi:hypothetical protein